MRLSRMMASRPARSRPPQIPSAASARPSSWKAPVTMIMAAVAAMVATPTPQMGSTAARATMPTQATPRPTSGNNAEARRRSSAPTSIKGTGILVRNPTATMSRRSGSRNPRARTKRDLRACRPTEPFSLRVRDARPGGEPSAATQVLPGGDRPVGGAAVHRDWDPARDHGRRPARLGDGSSTHGQREHTAPRGLPAAGVEDEVAEPVVDVGGAEEATAEQDMGVRSDDHVGTPLDQLVGELPLPLDGTV